MARESTQPGGSVDTGVMRALKAVSRSNMESLVVLALSASVLTGCSGVIKEKKHKEDAGSDTTALVTDASTSGSSETSSDAGTSNSGSLCLTGTKYNENKTGCIIDPQYDGGYTPPLDAGCNCPEIQEAGPCEKSDSGIIDSGISKITKRITHPKTPPTSTAITPPPQPTTPPTPEPPQPANLSAVRVGNAVRDQQGPTPQD